MLTDCKLPIHVLGCKIISVIGHKIIEIDLAGLIKTPLLCKVLCAVSENRGIMLEN